MDVNGGEDSDAVGEPGDNDAAVNVDMDEVSDDEDLNGNIVINEAKYFYASEMKRSFMFCPSERRK